LGALGIPAVTFNSHILSPVTEYLEFILVFFYQQVMKFANELI